jgi:hypothetical protein
VWEGDEQEMFRLQDRTALISDVRNRTLTLIERGMTQGVGAIFWFISHTMSCQPKGLGLHIYNWPRQPNIYQDASLRCCPKMLSSKMLCF